MATITVIQLQDDAPAGLLGPWAARHGLALDVRRGDHEGALPDPGSVGAAIVLGSDRSVNDHSVPWLAGLRDWAAAVLARDTPALGICFGAQLIATALGAPVSAMAAPEIGWIEIDGEDPGLSAGPWLSWHEDAIGQSDALRIVAGNPRGIQAYRARTASHQLGVQFHPEVTPQIVRDWARVDGGRALAAAGTTGRALERDSARLAASAATAADDLFDGWARGAALL